MHRTIQIGAANLHIEPVSHRARFARILHGRPRAGHHDLIHDARDKRDPRPSLSTKALNTHPELSFVIYWSIHLLRAVEPLAGIMTWHENVTREKRESLGCFISVSGAFDSGFRLRRGTRGSRGYRSWSPMLLSLSLSRGADAAPYDQVSCEECAL